MSTHETFASVIDAIGRDIVAAETGASAEAVKKWRLRDRIPGSHHLGVMRAAKAAGVFLDWETLARLAARHTHEAGAP